MLELPRDPAFDATVPLLRDPYRYISRRASELGSDAFRTRLMGRRTVCLTGPAGAALFYRHPALRRQGAIPAPVRQVLFGPTGVVQGLDGARHRRRKAMFLEMMSEARMDALDRLVLDRIDGRIPAWSDDVDLYRETRTLLAAAACEWSGVPLGEAEVATRADQLDDEFRFAGTVGPAHLLGVRSRKETQAWIGGVIDAVRQGQLDPPHDSPAAIVARWTGLDGAPLPREIAAAELLSVLRPTVAVAVWVVFLAHALHRHPTLRPAVADDSAYRHAFVQEVRRTYPFFPLLAAIAEDDVPLDGARILAGSRVLLDLWGTNRHPQAWIDGGAFRPERFRGWPGDPFTMIPQGGAEYATHHRCPGEWITIRLMEIFADLLAARLDYRVLTPAAQPDMSRLPALPPGGFRIGRVRRRRD
ncbi:cytochrome P450 [Roseitranquillus sediminis]|uniref:cytochrome P450 n=1 Tax=Roseitranquillus sediminis TaxID=2809051 RepID=UPI001D0BFE15|nr:cytochrome P450 [Roseitranquillus sediminis]MBM9593229.1 cytochrome P450 [Roseitranquillus sediminis]